MMLPKEFAGKGRVRLLRGRVFALACAAIAAACALLAQQAEVSSNASSADSHAFAQKSSVPGVPNFGIVSQNLLRGAQPTKAGFEQLSKMGVAIDVDLRDDGAKERDEVTKLGMKYVPIPWHCYNPLDDSIAQFLTLARNNPDKKIFVHCRLGTDRTGMMVAAYRMSQQGWSAREARKEMEAFGYSFEHHVICPGLGQYEKNFPHEFASSPAFEKLRPGAEAPAAPRK